MNSALAIKNFLPEQYEKTGKLPINHNYLQQQFADYEAIFDKLKKVVVDGDFTLGEAVNQFEDEFKEIVAAKHAVGVGSGTDALFLSLKALGIGEGDEVITTPFTFYATIGAIVTAGAKPVFADILNDYNINPEEVESRVTPKTRAILPVHWAGKPCDMTSIMSIADRHGLSVVEDACHAVQATYHGKPAGSLGHLGCFSFHPLKNLNVWGDGGIIVTNSDKLSDRLKLMRNHGLKGRDECIMFSFNSRLDTLQAVVASHLLKKLDFITQARINHAAYYDKYLSQIAGVRVPMREEYIKQVYHLYCIQCENRDELQTFLIERGIDAKVHYPVPMHLQPAAKYLGYKVGDFPVCEQMAKHTLSLPVHEFVSEEELNHVIYSIQEFYA
ncbi:MAG: pyridoxal-5'-phosphate-dependent protein [Gammaproteobacteria bacterium RIFCSPHIGHO2_12_FULL_37_14]|nr:MAG: pyridoxal-5'-phosphate-dependent protein [Gammaproteobacteria bacterium RIFCSPHIGHO2_12_FULL_37_14]